MCQHNCKQTPAQTGMYKARLQRSLPRNPAPLASIEAFMDQTLPAYSAVMFADVAGSTSLYEELGDRQAKDIIGLALSIAVAQTEKHAGVLVKTIGDEVMCRFPSADAAGRCAIAIQEILRVGIPGARQMHMRMGLHWGPVIYEHGDVFGDAVNVAARMSAIARAGQIITTQASINAMSRQMGEKARLVDDTRVKGKQNSMAIYELVWEEDNLTALAPAQAGDGAANVLHLEYRGTPLELPAHASLTMGRGDTCDLYVNSPLASRLHARIENRRNKFVYIDQSTNGSFVLTEDGKTVYLKREELILNGHGVISLGEAVKSGGEYLIRYSLSEPTVEIRR